MNRTALLSFALAGGFLPAQGPGFPPPCPPGQRGPEGMRRPEPMAMFKALNLTPEQEKAIQGVLDRHKAAVKSREQAAREKEDALRDAMEDPGVPEAKLRSLHLVASEARLQAMLEHRAAMLEINALLTPDQLAKARRIREGRQRERDAHRALAAELDDGQAPPPGGPGL